MAGREPEHPVARAFVHALRALGYVEGQIRILERRSAEGHVSRYGEIIAELVRLKTDVIVTSKFPLTQQTKVAPTTVPIVTVFNTDPVWEGPANSLARPGGNITGLARDPETDGKRMAMLKEAIPRVTRVTYLGTSEDWEGLSGKSVQAAAQAIGITLRTCPPQSN